jgi:putative glycosyltransferase (TIGR04372 family)
MVIPKIQNYLGNYWIIKILLFPIFIVLTLFYGPYIYFFYSRNIKKTVVTRKLFFHAHDDYGAVLELLYYIRCWTDLGNKAALIIFTPKSSLVKRLANKICPSVKIISPRILLSKIVQKSLSIFIKRFLYPPIYYHFEKKYPEAIYIYGIDYGYKWRHDEDFDEIKKNYACDNSFWHGYKKIRLVFERNMSNYKSFIQLTKNHKGIISDQTDVEYLINKLEINKPYVLLNINTKNYSNKNQNSRRIKYYERYIVLIDYLINKGYTVVLQGTKEQPVFFKQAYFIDYAHSNHQSPENDLLLFSACEFFISSKSGVEMYGILYNKPILGLNYTELTCMNEHIKMRFFPKHIKNGLGEKMTWRDYLSHPAYFQLGRMMPTEEEIEFLEMEEHEIIAALDEFLSLLEKPEEQWLEYSSLQKEFKKTLHPGHLDLYLICGVPCDAYLKYSN